MPLKVKALIPAAGRGKRLALLTGGRPKELLRIGPLTMIEHSLEMILDSGITEVGVVIGPGKEEIRRVLEEFWDSRGPAGGRLVFLVQDPPRGVAGAMQLAAHFAGDDPLAVVMPDNLLLKGPPALGQILEGFIKTEKDTIGVINLVPDRAGLFGNVGLITLGPARPGAPALVRSFSPKGPGVLKAAGTGPLFKGFTGVVYLPDWPGRIDGLAPNHEGELDDTDLVLGLVRESRLWAARMTGLGFDVGHPEGLAAARAAIRIGGGPDES